MGPAPLTFYYTDLLCGLSASCFGGLPEALVYHLRLCGLRFCCAYVC